MSRTTLEKIKQLHRDALAAQSEISRQIDATKGQINALTRHGTLPFDEAFSAWKNAFEGYCDTGRRTLERHLAGFARPTAPDPFTGHWPASPHPGDVFSNGALADGRPRDIGPLLAYLNQDAITAKAEAFFSDKCAANCLPAEPEREQEIERLVALVKDLEAERAEISLELERMFSKSDAIDAHPADDEEASVIAAMNKQIAKRNAATPEPKPSNVTIS